MMHLRRSDFLGHPIPAPDWKTQESICRFLDWMEKPNRQSAPSLPVELSKQQRIVARIEELAARIEEARELWRQAVEEARALLGSTLFACFDNFARNGTPEFPIAETAAILRGRGPFYLDGSGRHAINQKCVRWNGIDTSHAKEVSSDWLQALPSALFLRESDLLVNSTGEGTIGRACVATPNAIGLPFDSHVLVVRTNHDSIVPGFLAYFLRSPRGQAEIELSKGAKTTKQTELGVKKLGEISVPLPPITEQYRIVAYLDNLQAKVNLLEKRQSETAAELNALLPSVLDRAFRGKL